MRYCVDVLTAAVSPMYNEIRYSSNPNFFNSEEAATAFMNRQRESGVLVTDVIDLDNLPF